MKSETVALLLTLLALTQNSNAQPNWPLGLEYDLPYDDEPQLYAERVMEESRGDITDDLMGEGKFVEKTKSEVEPVADFQQRQVLQQETVPSFQDPQSSFTSEESRSRKSETTFALKGISSIITPELLLSLASAGWQDEIVLVDNDYPVLSLDTQTKIIRLVGVPMRELAEEILNLWKLSDEQPCVVMTNGTDITDTLKDVLVTINNKEMQCGINTALDNCKYLARSKFLERAYGARVVVQTSEPGPLTNIILRKGKISEDCLPSYTSRATPYQAQYQTQYQDVEMNGELPEDLSSMETAELEQNTSGIGPAAPTNMEDTKQAKEKHANKDLLPQENEDIEESGRNSEVHSKTKEHHTFKNTTYKHNLTPSKDVPSVGPAIIDDQKSLKLEMSGQVSNGMGKEDTKLFVDLTAMKKPKKSTHNSKVAEADELEDNEPKSKDEQAMFDNAESLNELQLPGNGMNSESENLKPEQLEENAEEIKSEKFSDLEPEESESEIKSDRVIEDLNYSGSELSFQKALRDTNPDDPTVVQQMREYETLPVRQKSNRRS